MMNSDAYSPPPSSKDPKPTLNGLDFMLNKAKLLEGSEQPPSSWTTFTSHGNGVDLHDNNAHSDTALAQVIVPTVASALCAAKRTFMNPP
jgi:hypothetical protein